MEDLPKISRLLHRVMIPVIFVLGSLMFLVVIAQVISRYIFSYPLAWSEELARYLMVWLACLAASEAYAKGHHVGVTLVLHALKPVARRIMILFIHLAVAVVMGVIAFQGVKLSYLLRNQVSPAMEVPMTWPYLAVPVGAGVMLIQALAFFFKQIVEPPPEIEIHTELDELDELEE